MEYGRKHEKEALTSLSQEISPKNQYKSGLVINKLIPWLAGTPDMIFQDADGQRVCVEVKCPSSLNPYGKTPEKTIYDLAYIQEGPALNTKHEYYLQVIHSDF